MIDRRQKRIILSHKRTSELARRFAQEVHDNIDYWTVDTTEDEVRKLLEAVLTATAKW